MQLAEICRTADKALRNDNLRTVGSLPPCPDSRTTGGIIHYRFTPGSIRTQQFRHIPPLDRQTLLEQIDRDDLGGHNLTQRDDLVIVLVVRQSGIKRNLSLQADVRTGLQPQFLHDRYMVIDDIDPLGQRHLFLTGLQIIHNPLQGICCLSHCGDHHHEAIGRTIHTHDSLQVSNA